jgi:hypothetical protein
MTASGAALPCLIFLAGCSVFGEPPDTFPNRKDADSACVQGRINYNPITFETQKEANAWIKAIDGTPTRISDGYVLPGKGPYCVAPGKHRLLVYTDHGYSDTSENYIDVEFEAGKRYSLHSNLRGMTFVVQLLEISGQTESKVAEFRLKSVPDSESRPLAVPLLVPSKK